MELNLFDLFDYLIFIHFPHTLPPPAQPTCTQNPLWTTTPPKYTPPPCPSPHLKPTPDQSWPKLNWGDPFYDIKRALWGSKMELKTAKHIHEIALLETV